MNKLTLHGATAAILGLVVASAIAQTQSTTTTTSTSYVQSSAVVGAKIRDARGEDVGVIKDFVLDRDTGCLAYVVLSTGKGGVLSSESKTVAAPWTVFTASSDPKVYVTRVEREKIYSAPVWESTRVDEYSRTDYLTNVYSYYGVPAPRFAEMSVGATNTTTGVTSSSNTTGTMSSSNTAAAPAMTAQGAMNSPAAAAPASSPLGTPEKTAAPRGTPSRVPPSTHTPGKGRETGRETASPSMRNEPSHEKKPAEERTRNPERETTESMESKPEKSERTEPQGKSSESKKRHGREPGSAPETESTPREP